MKPNKLSAALGFKTKVPMLPHQIEIMVDIKTRILGLVSGYGGGKTYTAVRKALQLALLNPGTDSIITEPNHPLLVQILLPEMHKALKEFNIPYVFKAGEKIFYLTTNGQTNRIICASAENVDRLIGINASAVILDEFDTSKPEIAYAAFIKLLGRLRAGTIRQMVLVSTPEGYGAMYRIFVKEKDMHKGHLVRAKTTDNFFLPKDFIQTMLQSYSPSQQKAYINGEFTNMNSESVFDFKRGLNHASVTIDNTDNDIYMACDFNIGGSVTIFALFQDDQIYVFGELVTKNTFETRDAIIDMFPTQDLWCAADASGSNGSSNASQSDHDLLLEVPGLALIQGLKNPMIQDSVLSVNSGLRNQKIWVDTDKCPKLTEALEQHAYGPDGKPEKFQKHEGGATDDFTDCIRYLTWAILPINKPTFHQYNQI